MALFDRAVGERERGGGLRDWANPFAVGVIVGLGCAIADAAGRRGPARGGQDPGAPLRRFRWSDPRAWRRVLWRTLKSFNRDRIPSAAAAVTYYMLLAIFPALSAFISLYSLVANVGDVTRRVTTLAGLLPGGALSVLRDQLGRLTEADHGALGIAFAVSLLTSIWSSNAGAKALIEALNIAYEARERRGFIGLTLLSLAFTVGALAVAVLALSLIVVAPTLLARFGVSFVGWGVGSALRWPLFVVLATLALSVVYRFGPDQRGVRWRWVTPGGAIAAISWLLTSALFSWYVANFGHYNKTYGSLGAIVGFLTWIWLSLIVVLFGAELNSEIEKAERGEAGGHPEPRR